jgi:ketosteroid isomerase-like protein
MTEEEEVIQRYFEAFNRHDLDAVMACFHAHPVVIDMAGRRFEGRADVRRHYEASFALLPDGRCDLQTLSGGDGRGMAESRFSGHSLGGRAVEAVGVEVVEVADGKITALRDYHRLVGDHPEAEG